MSDSMERENLLRDRVQLREAVFVARPVLLPDTVQEVFELELPYEKATLSLETGRIISEYCDRVLVAATANDRVLETVVYSDEVPEDEFGGVSETLRIVSGIADVAVGLASLGYRPIYPEGEGPVAVQMVPSNASEIVVEPFRDSGE